MIFSRDQRISGWAGLLVPCSSAASIAALQEPKCLTTVVEEGYLRPLNPFPLLPSTGCLHWSYPGAKPFSLCHSLIAEIMVSCVQNPLSLVVEGFFFVPLRRCSRTTATSARASARLSAEWYSTLSRSSAIRARAASASALNCSSLPLPSSVRTSQGSSPCAVRVGSGSSA